MRARPLKGATKREGMAGRPSRGKRGKGKKGKGAKKGGDLKSKTAQPKQSPQPKKASNSQSSSVLRGRNSGKSNSSENNSYHVCICIFDIYRNRSPSLDYLNIFIHHMF